MTLSTILPLLMMVQKNIKIKHKRICSICGADKTALRTKIQKSGTITKYYHWFRNKEKDGEWMCEICYSKLISTPKWAPILQARQITFRRKRVYVDKPRRIGVCNFCRAVTNQINAQTGKLCNRTSMAHMKYHEKDPLKDTIELCNHCHAKYDEGISFDRKCYVCGNNKTYLQDGWHARWYKSEIENEFLCEDCYNRSSIRRIKRKRKHI